MIIFRMTEKQLTKSGSCGDEEDNSGECEVCPVPEQHMAHVLPRRSQTLLRGRSHQLFHQLLVSHIYDGRLEKEYLGNPPLTWHSLFFYIMNFTFMDIYNYHFLSYCNSWRLSLILRSNKDYCFAEGLLYLQILTEINVSETCGYLF